MSALLLSGSTETISAKSLKKDNKLRSVVFLGNRPTKTVDFNALWDRTGL